MKGKILDRVERAKAAAIEVLLHNAKGPCKHLPRTAGWGYPEPYTRDLMIATLGVLASRNEELIETWRRVFEALAQVQTLRGHIPSLAHHSIDRGASDTTPLFLLALAVYRNGIGEPTFLDEAAQKALTWMDYQSPSDRVIVYQLPTSDWRDEQWVLGYGLFVNAVVYGYLRLFGFEEKAAILRETLGRFIISEDPKPRHLPEGLVVPHKAHYALWSYKIYQSDRFDLLGNSIAILTGLPSPTRANAIIAWVEHQCRLLQVNGELAGELPPNLFPYIRPSDPDWRSRYARFNNPGDYHNGGIWPFVSGFYVAALMAAGHPRLAEEKLVALTALVKPAREQPVAYGFNEWFHAQDGSPRGQDWQTWSAAMYLYAAACVQKGKPLFFEDLQQNDDHHHDDI